MSRLEYYIFLKFKVPLYTTKSNYSFFNLSLHTISELYIIQDFFFLLVLESSQKESRFTFLEIPWLRIWPYTQGDKVSKSKTPWVKGSFFLKKVSLYKLDSKFPTSKVTQVWLVNSVQGILAL